MEGLVVASLACSLASLTGSAVLLIRDVRRKKRLSEALQAVSGHKNYE